MSEAALSKSMQHEGQAQLAWLRSRYFWIMAGMLLLCGVLHYLTPQQRVLPLASFPLSRHVIERIAFLLPVAGAVFAFGRTAAIGVLALSVAIMLPRILFLSPEPIDALFEMLGVVIVGVVFVWLVDVQEKEKRVRQKAVEKLETLNVISTTLCQASNLDETLNWAMDKILEAVGNLKPQGAIFLLDPMTHNLQLKAQRGFSPDLLKKDIKVPLGECLCGIAAKSQDVLIVSDALNDPRHTRCLDTSPHSHVCIPLHSKDNVLGVLDLYLSGSRPVDSVDRQVFAAIGRQVGVAVENARLCENLRFYIRQITRAQEDERKRIARELHDETAQGLIDISRRLDDLASGWDRLPAAPATRLENLQERIANLLQGVRRFGRDLRPSVLDDLGLLPALEGLIDDMRHQQIEPVLSTRGTPRRLSSDAELALFRIVQEGLNNVRKHSEATEVEVEVEFFTDRVRVTVHDNGQGFHLQGRLSDLVATGKFGIVGIEERVQLLGGYFGVHTGPGAGTILIIDVPA